MEPAIADGAYLTVTPDIVARSLGLSAAEASRGVYLVTGGGGPHWVNLYDPSAQRCDCYDHEVRENVCKHLVRVLLDLGDRRLVARLRQLRAELQRATTGHEGPTLPEGRA